MLDAAVESGVTFFDTADVYGDGRSEQLIGRFLADHPDLVVTVATKMGRRAEQGRENYTLDNFRTWLDRSRRNLAVDRIDLVQLHCPPSAVYSRDEIYDALDTLVAEGVIAAYGVSVETCDEALTAISRRGTATVQIILNAFRRSHWTTCCRRRRPPASASSPGCRWRAGCSAADTPPRPSSPRTTTANYNRHGESFDVGETFSGVDFETGVAAAAGVRRLVAEHHGSQGHTRPGGAGLGGAAARCRPRSFQVPARPEQARANAAAGCLPALPVRRSSMRWPTSTTAGCGKRSTRAGDAAT